MRGECAFPEEFKDFLVMKEMGWDYYTYLRQPDDLIILIQEFIKLLHSENGIK